MKKKDVVIFIGLILSCAIIATVFSRIVPFNMDEVLPYNLLHDLTQEKNSLESYDVDLSLNVWNSGLKLPLRAWDYLGSFPSIYYSIFYFLWKSPVSVRFMGLVMLLIEAVLLSRIFKIKYYYVFIGLLFFFPYFFQHIVDTGLISVQVLSVILIFYLSKRWMIKKKIKYPVLIGIVAFCGVWIKLTYLWLLPWIGLMIFFNIPAKHYKKIISQSITGIFILRRQGSIIISSICVMPI